MVRDCTCYLQLHHDDREEEDKSVSAETSEVIISYLLEMPE